MRRGSYTLAVAGHKGGTGRTTCALALTNIWSEQGVPVTLVDADPLRSARLVAVGRDGKCPWRHVVFRESLPAAGEPTRPGEMIVIDTPSLVDAAGLAVLERADGLILCAQADPLSLRTVPTAAATIQAARAKNKELQLLGIVIGLYDKSDDLQNAMLKQLRQRHGELLLEPPIPLHAALRDWPLKPGTPLPSGSAREAFLGVAEALRQRFGPQRPGERKA